MSQDEIREKAPVNKENNEKINRDIGKWSLFAKFPDVELWCMFCFYLALLSYLESGRK